MVLQVICFGNTVIQLVMERRHRMEILSIITLVRMNKWSRNILRESIPRITSLSIDEVVLGEGWDDGNVHV
jgi:hypothetical protein